MTLLDLSLRAAFLIFCCSSTSAQTPACGNKNSVSIAEFVLRSCVATPDAVVREFYEAPVSMPVDSTDFDKKTLEIARGVDIDAVKARSGIRQGANGFMTQTGLLQPPAAEQISRRQMSKVQKHRDWSVSIETIDYSTPGKTPGYALMCGTAVRVRPSPAVAARCFPFGAQNEFLKLLDRI